jgi:hypothetical protein
MGVSLGPAGIVGYGSSVTNIIVLSKSHRKWTVANHAGGFATWHDATNGSCNHTKRSVSSTLAITAHLAASVAWGNCSGANHGYLDARLKITAPNGNVFYSGTSRAWWRLDTVTGITESIQQMPLEYISAGAAVQQTGSYNIVPQYQYVKTSGTGMQSAGINTWGGGSIIQVWELDNQV